MGWRLTEACSTSKWREEQKCKIDRLLQDEASLVLEGEEMSFSNISSVLTESVKLEEVLQHLTKIFGLFGKDIFGSFCWASEIVAGRGVLRWGARRSKTDFYVEWIY